jgi:hypothetical protein
MLRNFIVISPYGFEFGAALAERSPPSETESFQRQPGKPSFYDYVERHFAKSTS